LQVPEYWLSPKASVGQKIGLRYFPLGQVIAKWAELIVRDERAIAIIALSVLKNVI